MKVRDVMRRWFERVDPETSVLEAARVMTLTGQQALPVVDHQDRLVGMIAEGDILARLLGAVSKDVYTGIGNVDQDAAGCYHDICRLPVGGLMSQRLVTATPEMPALRAAGIMRARRVQRLPVVDGEQLVGLIFQTDVHAALLAASVRRQPTPGPGVRSTLFEETGSSR
jgi:CBS domain-containing protein